MHTSIVYIREEKKFIIKWEDELNFEKESQKWQNNIMSLVNWMGVTVKNENNEIALSILKHVLQ